MGVFKKGFLRGIIGPVIVKKFKDKQQVTIKPDYKKVKQTPATKNAANTFGLAGSLSKILRDIFDYESDIVMDGSVHHRLTATLDSALIHCRDQSDRKFYFREDSFHMLEGFEFNSKLRLRNKLPAKVSVLMEHDVLRVAFPKPERPLLLKFPEGATSAELTFSVVFFRLHEGLMSRNAIREVFRITCLDTDLRGLSNDFAIPRGSFCVLAISIEYFKRSRPVVDDGLNASAIYWAQITPGVYEEGGEFLWAENGLYL